MSTPLTRQPIPRRNVAVAGLGLFLLFAAVIAAAEWLRHPAPEQTVPESELAGSDPRDELLCPEPLPREGQTRDTDPASTAPVRVSSNELYDCPQSFDGRRVVYRGEVVGGLLERDRGVWTQLNDDVYAELLGPLPSHRDYRGGNGGVGVLLPYDAAELVTFVGGPQTRGDVLEVLGTFHRIDPTGEVAVILVDGASRISDGEPFPDPLLNDRLIAGLAAMLLAIALTVTERVVASRR